MGSENLLLQLSYDGLLCLIICADASAGWIGSNPKDKGN